jgi:hypothetical protein
MIPAAPQETVGEAGIEPGTAAWFQLVILTTELPHPHLWVYYSTKVLCVLQVSELLSGVKGERQATAAVDNNTHESHRLASLCGRQFSRHTLIILVRLWFAKSSC